MEGSATELYNSVPAVADKLSFQEHSTVQLGRSFCAGENHVVASQ